MIGIIFSLAVSFEPAMRKTLASLNRIDSPRRLIDRSLFTDSSQDLVGAKKIVWFIYLPPIIVLRAIWLFKARSKSS